MFMLAEIPLYISYFIPSVNEHQKRTDFTGHGVTLEAPNNNCSRRHFNFSLLSFEENKA